MNRRVLAGFLPAMILILAGVVPGCGADNQQQSKIVPVPASDNVSAEQRRSGGGGTPPAASDTTAQRSGSRPSSYPAAKK